MAESPGIVGRAAELERLSSALGRAAAGVGGAVVIAGEAGVGKTHLAREVLRQARALNLVALEGTAYPLDGTLAYAPLLQALRPAVQAEGRGIVAGLPQLHVLFPDLGEPPAPLGDPALEKTRLFEAVTQLLARLTAQRPAVLLLDDLHWSDTATLELASYLLRAVAWLPLLLIATYRTQEPDPPRGLSTLLTTLRHVGAEEIVLSGLSRQETEALVHSLLGGDPPAALIDLIERRSGGLPLFIRELLQSLRDGGGLLRVNAGWLLVDGSAAMPALVRDVIRSRLDRLCSADRDLLGLIAACGVSASPAVLRAASGHAPADLAAGLRRLRDAGLVREQQDVFGVRYASSHPLMDEIVYQELPAPVRAEAHAAIADALEQVAPDDVETLARHYREAGAAADPQRAIDVLLAAASRTDALQAGGEAERYLAAALTHVRVHRPAQLPAVLEQLGEAHARGNALDAAVAVWQEALALAERNGTPEEKARLLRRLAGVEWERGRFDVSNGYLDAACAALAGVAPSQELAALMQARVVQAGRLGDAAAAAAVAREVASLPAALRSLGLQIEVLNTQLSTTVALDYQTVREDCERIYAEAAQAGDLQVVERAGVALTMAETMLGQIEPAHERARSMRPLVRRLGMPALEVFLLMGMTWPDVLAGRWDEALDHVDEADAIGRRIGRGRLNVGLASARCIVLALRGEVAAARAALDDASALFGPQIRRDRRISGMIDYAAVTLALEQDDPAAADAAADALVRTPGPYPLLGLAFAGSAYVAAGKLDAARAVASRLADAPGGPGAFPAVAAARLDGLVLWKRGYREAGADLLARTACGFERLGLVFDQARTELELADLLRGTQPRQAGAHARIALDLCERLGARRYAERGRWLLHALGARRRRVVARPNAPRLSAREREVAALVVEGLTTPQIAARLVVSPRTVSAHLDRLYTRLGVGSRTALARYVLEHKLLSDSE